MSDPIPMILHCPRCGLQHIDAPDERTPEWTNPPHRSHLCHGCGCIWRPADVATTGVEGLATAGSADNWVRTAWRCVACKQLIYAIREPECCTACRCRQLVEIDR